MGTVKHTTTHSMAIIGAGPVGLATAIFAAQKLPHYQITLYDARPLDADLNRDQRVLALAYGSIQFLERLQVGSPMLGEAIKKVHISQQQPSCFGASPEVTISAQTLGQPLLGTTLAYSTVLEAMQKEWNTLVQKDAARLQSCFGQKVKGLKNISHQQVEVDAAVVVNYDLVVIAEGGIFSDQPTKSVVCHYGQRAWIGKATLKTALNQTAYERFTAHGPAALLPLGTHEAALVWCQKVEDDPVLALTDKQRLTLLNSVFSQQVGEILALTPLQSFELGLNAEKTLFKGRQVKIGNAAQTLHPVAGQGLNLGLRDVYTLVERLSRYTDVEQALSKMNFSRTADRWGTMGFTDLLARGFVWEYPLMSEFRAGALAAIEKVPFLKKQLASQLMFGWRW